MVSPTLFSATLLASFLFGGILALVAVLGPSLANQLKVEQQRALRLLALVPLAWIIFMPLSGWMTDGWGVQPVLFAGCLGLAMNLGWLGMGQHQLAAASNLLVLALASAMVTISTAALMPFAFFRDQELPAGSFGLGYTVASIGYLATHWVWPRLERRFGFSQTLLGLALGCLLPAALVALGGEDFPTSHPHAFWTDWSGDSRLWLVGLALFLYFPLEQILDVWPRPFLNELGYKERSIPYLLAGFWLAFLAVRLSAGWIMRPEYEGWFLLTLILMSSMILGNLGGAYAPSSGGLGFWLLGGCYGPLLPTFLSIVVSIFEKTPATALGAIYALAALNLLVVRPGFAAYTQTHSARDALRIPMLLGLVMAATTLVLTLIRFL